MCVLMRAFGGSSGAVSFWRGYAAGRGTDIFYHVRRDVGFELELDNVCDSHGYCYTNSLTGLQRDGCWRNRDVIMKSD